MINISKLIYTEYDKSQLKPLLISTFRKSKQLLLAGSYDHVSDSVWLFTIKNIENLPDKLEELLNQLFGLNSDYEIIHDFNTEHEYIHFTNNGVTLSLVDTEKLNIEV